MAKNGKISSKPTSRSSKKHGAKAFFSLIWAVIRNKKDTNGQFTKVTFTLLMSYLLNLFAILLFFFSIICIFATIHEVPSLTWHSINWFTNILAIIGMLLVCFIALLFAIMLRGFANEIEREKDKNYIVAVFSAIVSFVALIVAFVALVGG